MWYFNVMALQRNLRLLYHDEDVGAPDGKVGSRENRQKARLRLVRTGFASAAVE
jgi:hypothetical protein